MEADYMGNVELSQTPSVEDSLNGYEVGYLGETVENDPNGIVTSI
jgi:hypothetical protein